MIEQPAPWPGDPHYVPPYERPQTFLIGVDQEERDAMTALLERGSKYADKIAVRRMVRRAAETVVRGASTDGFPYVALVTLPAWGQASVVQMIDDRRRPWSWGAVKAVAMLLVNATGAYHEPGDLLN